MLLFSMVAHEWAHAEAAYRQGDDTAYLLGRLTLNPLKHIDPFMTILLPALLLATHAGFLFGAAKPVPVTPRNYRNYRKGDVIVSLAGIAMNLALFLVCAALFPLIGLLGDGLPGLQASLAIFQRMLLYGMTLNLVLAFFNLIPIPPLDGSHVLYQLLPPRAGLRFRQLYAFGFIPIFLVLAFVPTLLTPFLWPVHALMRLGWSLVGGFALPGVS
ncbi:MAG TPA: site-2 protease family protein [Gemmatimonadales bacterium]|nr:site-2 protease family protein [Gemmatimonadales bacterium]